MTECADCERCTWNPGPDCQRADHPHCPTCGHCLDRHRGSVAEDLAEQYGPITIQEAVRRMGESIAGTRPGER